MPGHRAHRAANATTLAATLRRGWPLGVALALVLLAVVAWRGPLAEYLWPQARAEVLRARAAQALAQGRLSASDGSGARELYEAALAMDPDRDDALLGLARVADAALVRSRAAIGQERFADAGRDLALARALDAPRARVDPVATLLREREAARAGIGQLLARATAARAAHRLDGSEDAALPLYQRVLSLRPRMLEALEGREDALADLLQSAQAALTRGDLATASGIVAAARGYDAGHAGLPGIEAALAGARENARAQAQHQRRAASLRHPGSPSRQRAQPALLQLDAVAVADARRCYQDRLRRNDLGRARDCLDRWQSLAADDAGLSPARRRLAERWLAHGEERLGAGEVQRAAAALVAARRIDPATPGLDAFAERLRAAGP